MKKKLVSIVLILIASMIMTGCCLQHDWQPATCEEPKTCSKCGKTDGEPLGHKYEDGNCVTPRICSVCGEAEGEAPGHIWIKETCMAPRTCSVCGAVEGEAAPHTWVEATCLKPRHCAVCGIEEGSTNPHQWAEANYNAPRTCLVCGATEGEALTSYVDSAKDFTFTLNSGVAVNYSTITGYDNRIANGTVKVVSYNKYTSDSTHPAKEGYEWREVQLEFSMDKPSRVMWGYTDKYMGMNEYANSDFITYSDGTREKVATTQSFRSETLQPSVTPSPTAEPTPSPTAEPTQAPTTAPTQGASATGSAPSPSPPTAPQITPDPTPSPSPTPESEPGKYLSYVTQAIQVPIRYDGLIFYVCNADYEKDHKVDDSFLYMDMK